MTEQVSEMQAAPSAVKRQDAQNTVKTHVVASMTVGLVPVPVFDLAGLMTVAVNMVLSLSELYGQNANRITARALVVSLLNGAIPTVGLAVAGSLFKGAFGLGTVAGSATTSLTAGATTYAIGQALIRHMENGGTLEDFDMRAGRAVFRESLSDGKRVAQSLMETVRTRSQPKAETSSSNNSE